METTTTRTTMTIPDSEMRARSLAHRRARAAAHVAPLLPLIYRRRREGASLNQIAWEMNSAGRFTVRGKPWSGAGLHQMLRRHPEGTATPPPTPLFPG